MVIIPIIYYSYHVTNRFTILRYLARCSVSQCCLDNKWFDFAASMARKVYLRGGLGVGAFRRIYGGSKRNGSRPRHFGKSSGAVARHILQQLQNMNIVELDTRG